MDWVEFDTQSGAGFMTRDGVPIYQQIRKDVPIIAGTTDVDEAAENAGGLSNINRLLFQYDDEIFEHDGMTDEEDADGPAEGTDPATIGSYAGKLLKLRPDSASICNTMRDRRDYMPSHIDRIRRFVQRNHQHSGTMTMDDGKERKNCTGQYGPAWDCLHVSPKHERQAGMLRTVGYEDLPEVHKPTLEKRAL
ncbi:uncharacterized protein N0V89_003525 [Didymosphaeria variabile]|uniref:Uncharacterized protein n=1 Tax=Didymosphaeria variabile TaxID=1932322 RepID=A0A9W9CCE3_9PLEO|nr:uncharacterized protein N0V89_003525 [Didymosphaeria variabile]KAJ4355508.1 hypothetical protein N0V89_003525 [Didymosphaeria variabile]